MEEDIPIRESQFIQSCNSVWKKRDSSTFHLYLEKEEESVLYSRVHSLAAAFQDSSSNQDYKHEVKLDRRRTFDSISL